MELLGLGILLSIAIILLFGSGGPSKFIIKDGFFEDSVSI
jgi:hypothetical protein